MSQLLNPQIIVSIKNLQLAAKTTIDSFMMGISKSNVKGQGLEFSQYRIYEPGDDLRWLDWKMYARSDRYYIRESEVDTSISVRFVIDATNSMNHTDSGFRKIDYAKYMTACLGYLASTQGDAIGLYVFKEDGVFALPSKKDTQHLKRFYYQLETIEPQGKFTDPIHYKQLIAANKTRELLVVVTDFYEEAGEMMQLLNSLATYKNEILVLHLMGDNELTLNYEGYAYLEDLETGQQISIGSSISKKEYTDKLQQHLNNIKEQLLSKGIAYTLINTKLPVDKALKDFLNQRSKLI
ncbi:DUF58 domain-containing protein [Parasediminibacterium paludis]|uniref:DUF58 domain-containing protein n=1 Tax=Parasediminibacterium paludis TaxID=908966 RepID=A0ABV8PVD9_9BACT